MRVFVNSVRTDFLSVYSTSKHCTQQPPQLQRPNESPGHQPLSHVLTYVTVALQVPEIQSGIDRLLPKPYTKQECIVVQWQSETDASGVLNCVYTSTRAQCQSIVVYEVKSNRLVA